MGPRSSVVTAVMAASLMAASCGSSPPSPAVPELPTTSIEVAGASETAEFAAPAWTMTELGERDVDAGVAVAAIGENLVVMSTTGRRLTAWVDAGGGWTIFGFATLVDENTIEYTIADGEVIGVYEPSDEQPPGCM